MSTLPSGVAALIERFSRNREATDRQINHLPSELYSLIDHKLRNIEVAA
jgi:hypothetical protein